jgi:AcrR family transcriptional regulator
MLSGSLYYHFQSKDELIEEIYREGARILSEAVSHAILDLTDPWARLENACIAHVEARLGGGVFAPVVSSEGLHTPAPLRDKLVAYRDSYEQLFRDLVAALDLPAAIDRSVYRLSLLSALNAIPMWYRPGGRTPTEIAQQIFTIYDRRCRA